MGKTKIDEIVMGLTEPIVSSLNLELVDVEYIKEGSAWFLRIFIDKPGGITHDDCQAVSERLGKLLDEKDPILQSYVLEVSSPGIERPLKKREDFERFKGYKVRAFTFAPVDGKKEFVGELGSLEDEVLTINVDGKTIKLQQDQVARVRLEAEI